MYLHNMLHNPLPTISASICVMFVNVESGFIVCLFKLKWQAFSVLIASYRFLLPCVNVNSKGKKSQEQPGRAVATAAAAAGDVPDNGYCSIDNHNNHSYDYPPTYDYIHEAASSPSVTQEHEYSRPRVSLSDPKLGGSSVL